MCMVCLQAVSVNRPVDDKKDPPCPANAGDASAMLAAAVQASNPDTSLSLMLLRQATAALGERALLRCCEVCEAQQPQAHNMPVILSCVTLLQYLTYVFICVLMIAKCTSDCFCLSVAS